LKIRPKKGIGRPCESWAFEKKWEKCEGRGILVDSHFPKKPNLKIGIYWFPKPIITWKHPSPHEASTRLTLGILISHQEQLKYCRSKNPKAFFLFQITKVFPNLELLYQTNTLFVVGPFLTTEELKECAGVLSKLKGIRLDVQTMEDSNLAAILSSCQELQVLILISTTANVTSRTPYIFI